MSYTLHRPPLTRGRLHPVPGAYFPHASLQIAPVAFCILERRMQYHKPETDPRPGLPDASSDRFETMQEEE